MQRNDPATIPVARPLLPSARKILPYLREIDGNRRYANHGPLARRLTAELAMFWGVPGPAVSLVSNATMGLSVALQAAGARPGGSCLMPSWTFAASAGAVRNAGLQPHFMDVDPGTWALDPAETLALARRLEPAAILVVAPFGAPLDLAAWDRVAAESGVPVVIDAAAAFDTLRSLGPMRPGRCPVVVSLHATKVFGIGEGGAVICRDAPLMDRIVRLAQFGFLGTRDSILPGTNAKLSEYGAAVGLAALDGWTDTRARWAALTAGYRYRLQLVPGLGLTPGFGEGWVGSTMTVLWPGTADQAADTLAGQRIETLRWWGRGCHEQPAYHACPAEQLPTTSGLADRAIGLPMYPELSIRQLDHICSAVSRGGRLAAPAVPSRAGSLALA